LFHGDEDIIRQYHAQRRQGGDNPRGVGVIAVGSVYYIQDDGFWRDRFRSRAACRNPWIVRGLNGTISVARRIAVNGLWEDVESDRLLHA
jgi:hypothetical protein